NPRNHLRQTQKRVLLRRGFLSGSFPAPLRTNTANARHRGFGGRAFVVLGAKRSILLNLASIPGAIAPPWLLSRSHKRLILIPPAHGSSFALSSAGCRSA